MAKRIIWVVVLVTLLPSIYFGYDMVQQNRFVKNANRFIAVEAHFPNDYLLNKKIDPKSRKITLVFGGKEIMPEQIKQLKGELKKYGLASATLEVKQGFAYLSETKSNAQNDQLTQMTVAMAEKEKQEKILQAKSDSMDNLQKLSKQVYAELKTQYPALKNAVIQPSVVLTDSSTSAKTYLVLLSLSSDLPEQQKSKIENWLKIRLKENNIILILQ